MVIRNITFFDPDIHKIPEYNWQKFQRCLLMSAGIGSTIQELMSHIDKVHIYAQEKREDDLNNELLNLKLSLFSTLEGISYDCMALACMVTEINGEKPSIVTDTDIRILSNQITATGLTRTEMHRYLEDLKKKLILN